MEVRPPLEKAGSRDRIYWYSAKGHRPMMASCHYTAFCSLRGQTLGPLPCSPKDAFQLRGFLSSGTSNIGTR